MGLYCEGGLSYKGAKLASGDRRGVIMFTRPYQFGGEWVGGGGVYTKLYWGPVVGKPINANPPLKINQGFRLAYFKCFQ